MTEKGSDMSEELLQQYGLFIIGAGLALVMLLVLFLLLRRASQTKRGLRPSAAAIAAEAHEEAVSEPSLKAPSLADKDEEAMTIAIGAQDDASQDSGFKLFKRKSKKPAKSDVVTASDIDQRLREIEQEMLAIRELFRDGQITQSVYVAETQALYETAKLIQE